MRISACLWLAAWVLPIFSLPAAAASVDIVITEDNPAMLNLARAAQHALQQIDTGLDVVIYTPTTVANNVPRDALAIVIGDDLLAWATSKHNAYPATIYFYISSINYRIFKISTPNSALFRDQPLLRQLQLAQMLLPNIRSAAIMHRVQQFADIDSQRAKIRRNLNLSVEFEAVNSHDDWAKSLSQLMSNTDVLIGVDDRELYNRDTIRSILLTAYRHGKVLIGPNRSFVAAGSLASAYTSPEHYLQQLQEMVRSWSQTRSLPEPQFPRDYEVSVNRQVANSLGLTFPDDATLLQQLRTQLLKRESCAHGC